MLGPISNGISQARQLQLTAGEHILVGTPTADVGKALLRIGAAITGGSAAGTYFGGKLPTGFVGDLMRFEHADSAIPLIDIRCFTGGVGKVGFGKTPGVGDRRVSIQGSADDALDGSLTLTNATNGTAAGVGVSLSSGAAPSGCSGTLSAFNAAYSGNAAHADRIVLFCNSDASGLVFDANQATQDMRFRVGTLNEQMRLSASGELLIGTATSLGRLAVVGRADQLQLALRANGTQTGNMVSFGDSSGAGNYFTMDGAGRSGFGAAANASYQVNIEKNANDATTLRIGNPNTGNAAGSVIQFQASGCGGAVGAYASTHATTLLADHVAIIANSDALGIHVQANAASQYVRFAVGTLNEQMRLSSAGELLIGTTSSLGRLAVVGRADQIQLAIRMNSTQNQLAFEVATSGGSSRFGITSNGSILAEASDNARHRLNSSTTDSNGMFKLTAANAATIPLVLTAFTAHSSVLLSVRNVNEGNLLTVNNLGDLTLNRTSSTTEGRQVGSLIGTFAVSTDATRQGRIQLFATDFNGDREILRGEGDGTNPKIGFLGATAVVRPTSTTDLRQALINLGLYTTGGASPLSLNGGVFASANATITGNADVVQLTVVGNATQNTNIVNVQDAANSTPFFTIRNSGNIENQRRTNANRVCSGWESAFAVSTDATREGRFRLTVADFNVANRTVVEGRANGTVAMIGFLGAAAVVQQAIGAAATDPATTQTLANNIRTALINFGLCTT